MITNNKLRSMKILNSIMSVLHTKHRNDAIPKLNQHNIEFDNEYFKEN